MSLNVTSSTMGATSSVTPKIISVKSILNGMKEAEQKAEQEIEIGTTDDTHYIVNPKIINSDPVTLEDLDSEVKAFLPLFEGVAHFRIPPYVDYISTRLSETGILYTEGVTYTEKNYFFVSDRPENTIAYEIQFDDADFWFDLIIHSNDRKLAKEIHTAGAEKLTLGIAPKEVLDWLVVETSFSKRNGEGNPEFEKSSLITVLGYSGSAIDRGVPSLD